MEDRGMAGQSTEKGKGGGAGDKAGPHSAEGQKGVSQETVGSGKKQDPNNFANDPRRAAEAGRKGGQARGKG
jgi:general stress protein YciG